MIKTRLTKKQISNRVAKVNDAKLPIEERRKANNEIMDQIMNPSDNFDPENFDPKADKDKNYAVKKRPREKPPRELPTMGMSPKKMLQGQMIGMYESKQDLYLLIAHVNNTLLTEIDSLKSEVEKLKGMI